VEIAGLGETLPDQLGPDHLSRIVDDQAAIGLVRHHRLPDAGHGERIGDPAQQGETDRHDDRGADGRCNVAHLVVL
jgi:hypothetical protein